MFYFHSSLEYESFRSSVTKNSKLLCCRICDNLTNECCVRKVVLSVRWIKELDIRKSAEITRLTALGILHDFINIHISRYWDVLRTGSWA